jgi:hypothetical protein
MNISLEVPLWNHEVRGVFRTVRVLSTGQFRGRELVGTTTFSGRRSEFRTLGEYPQDVDLQGLVYEVPGRTVPLVA